jgi:hypothetical protein
MPSSLSLRQRWALKQKPLIDAHAFSSGFNPRRIRMSLILS